MTNKLVHGITVRADNEYVEVISSIREVIANSSLNNIEILGILNILQSEIHYMSRDEDLE